MGSSFPPQAFTGGELIILVVAIGQMPRIMTDDIPPENSISHYVEASRMTIIFVISFPLENI